MDGMEQRSESFASGINNARTVQQSAVGGYRPRSVLDTLTRSGSGYSVTDQSRRLLNGQLLPTSNGLSDDTSSRRTLLDNPYRPAI